MKLELSTKWAQIPRDTDGDPGFTVLDNNMLPEDKRAYPGVAQVFTPAEIVELVNRALYQLEYQAGAHAKYGRVKRAKAAALKAALKDKGVDPKAQRVKDELEGK